MTTEVDAQTMRQRSWWFEEMSSNNGFVTIIFIAFHPPHHIHVFSLHLLPMKTWLRLENNNLLTLKMRQEREQQSTIGRLETMGWSRDGIFTVKTAHLLWIVRFQKQIEVNGCLINCHHRCANEFRVGRFLSSDLFGGSKESLLANFVTSQIFVVIQSKISFAFRAIDSIEVTFVKLNKKFSLSLSPHSAQQ